MRKSFAALALPFLMAACVTAPTTPPVYMAVPSNRVIAPLDSELARPCELPPYTGADDYDAWQEFLQTEVLAAFAACANRLSRMVDLWGSEVRKNPAAAPVTLPEAPAAQPAAPTWPAIPKTGN